MQIAMNKPRSFQEDSIKMSNFTKRVAVVAVFALCFASAALADTIVFNLSPTDGTTFRSGEFGPGQGVSVSTTQTISSVGFYLGGSAQNLNFFVFDGSNTTVLASDQFAWGGS